jgi:hypothetical protein
MACSLKQTIAAACKLQVPGLDTKSAGPSHPATVTGVQVSHVCPAVAGLGTSVTESRSNPNLYLAISPGPLQLVPEPEYCFLLMMTNGDK